MDREQLIIEYIELNPFCTKTKLKNSMPFAGGTTDNILKKLIHEDKTVTCLIDEVNPRIHHLILNNEYMFALKGLKPIMAKVKERMKRQRYTRAPLITGEWVSIPTSEPDWNDDAIDKVAKMAIGGQPFFLKTGRLLIDRSLS